MKKLFIFASDLKTTDMAKIDYKALQANREVSNHLILGALFDMIQMYPSLRLGQVLVNLGIVQDEPVANTDRIDIFNEEPVSMFLRCYDRIIECYDRMIRSSQNKSEQDALNDCKEKLITYYDFIQKHIS